MNFIIKTIFSLLGIGSYAVYHVVVLILIGKFYSMEDLGVYAFLFSSSSVLFFLTNLGFRQLIVTSTEYVSIGQYFRLRILLSFISFLIIFLVGKFVYPDFIFLALIIAAIKFFESLSEIGYAVYQKMQNHKYQSYILFFKSVLSLVFLVVAINQGLSLTLSLFLVFFIHFLFFITYEFSNLRTFFNDCTGIQYLRFKKNDLFLICYAFPFGFAMFLINLNLNLSRVASGIFLSEYDTAVLAASLQLALFFSPVVNGVCQVLLPRFTQSIMDNDYLYLKRLFFYISFIFIFISSLTSLFVFYWGDFVLFSLYNEEISNHGFIFFVCVVGASFNYISALANNILTALGEYKIQSTVMVVCIVLNSAGMIFFIDFYGLYALVWSFVASSVFRFLVLYYFSLKLLRLRVGVKF